MTVICPSCGAEIPERFRFCGFCGESVDIAIEDPSPEIQLIQDRNSRRLVTVLFADLTNFTKASEGIDPEIIYRTLRNTLEKHAQIIKKFGGRVDRYYGDGYLATFGIPEAHEDDYYRALLAALEMQQLMKRLQKEARQKLKWDMRLRIGVNLGSVIRGQLDTGSLQDTSIFGHAVNLASRLQSAARPGTILVNETVYRQARSKFDFLDPVVLQLRGIDKPVVAYELTRLRSDPEPTRGLKGRSTPLIGRDFEHEILITRVERLQIEHQGVVALITGEAGIGKSRLVEEVLPLQTESVMIGRGQGSPFDSSSYAFIKDILKNLAGITPDDLLTTQQERLGALISYTGESGKEIKSTLIDLVIHDSTGDEFKGDPREYQRKIIALIRRIFTQLAKRHPLVVIFDDIQWADKSSLDVISHSIDLTHEIPLALIFIARTSFRDCLPDFLQESSYSKSDIFLDIRLDSLSAEESDHLVDTLLREGLVPSSLKTKIYERSGGNPLFIEELVRILLDEAIIQESSKGWRLSDQWKDFIEDIPATVSGLLLSRYDHQPPELQAILDMASVLGPRFPLPLLSAVLNTPETELRPKITHLEQADLLRSSTGISSPVFFFRHALMQEVIYETILFEDRKKLHRKVAETLKNIADEYYFNANAIIGYHLERSGSKDAIDFLLKAATQSAKRYANDEAISYYKRIQKIIASGGFQHSQTIDIALGLGEVLNRVGESELALDQLKEALERSSTSPLSNYRLGDIHYQLGRAYYDSGELNEALSNFERAASLLEESPGECRSFNQTDTDREIGWIFCRQGKLGQALPRAESALLLAKEVEDLDAEGNAQKLLASIHFWNGQLQNSIKNAEASLNIREQVGDIWRAASSQTTLGHLYHQSGQWPLAEKMLRQAIYVQREIGDNYVLAGSWTNLGLLLLDKGQLDEALDCMNEAINTSPKHDFPLAMTSSFYLNRGSVLLRLGNIDDAIEDFERGLVGAKNQTNEDLCALANAYLAEAQIKRGQLPSAEVLMEEAEELICNSESIEFRTEILRIKSYLLRKKQDYDTAISTNVEAQNLIRGMGNRYEYARLLIDKAKIHIAQAEEEGSIIESDIRAEVEEALDIFQQLGAETGISWAEEILYRIVSSQTISEDQAVRFDHYPIIVIVIKIETPLLLDAEHSEPFDSAAKVQKRIAADLNRIATKQNVFLIKSPSGFTFLISNIQHETIKDRMAIEAIEYALSAIAAVVRLNNISRNKYGFEVDMKVSIAIGTSPELIRDCEQAAIFSSISQIGRQAQTLAEFSPEFQILVTGDIPKTVHEAYELEEFSFGSDRRLTHPVYRLGKAISRSKLPQALPKSSAKLVGRNREFSRLKKWIDQIGFETLGQVIYIEAEAGMGKTRILEELMACSDSMIQFLHGKCESFRSSISYWPLIQALEKGDIKDSIESQRLKSLLGLYPPDEGDKYLFQSLPPEALRKELFSRTRDFLKKQTSNNPVVLVFEDIHDIDLSSIDLLDFLFPIIYEIPISIMLIARAEMPGPHRSIVKKAERVCRDRYLQISFSDLTRDDSIALAQELLRIKTLPNGLTELIEPFFGHPLSLEEIIRFLIEGGWLMKSNGTWKLIDLTASIKRDMPATFRDLLLRRLNFLDHESLHVLQAGALLGEVFDRMILNRMIPGSKLAERLSELSERGWLHKPRDGNPLLFQFSHTLTRETIYSTLVRSKRQLLHQRAGEAIEALYPESQEENLELLAHHFDKSGMYDKSLHYSIRAAEKCAHRYALDESRRYFRRSEDILTHQYPSQSRIMARVLLGLTDVLLKMGETAQAVEMINNALAADRHISDALQAAYLRRLGEALHLRGDLHLALGKYNEALEKIASTKNSHLKLGGEVIVSWLEEQIDIQIGLSKIYFDLYEHEKAVSQINGVLEDISRKEFPEKTAELFNLLAGISYRQSDFDSAHQLLEKCLAIYQTNGNRSGASLTYSNLGILAAAHQEFEAAHDYFSLSLDIHKALGDSNGIAITTNNLGQLEINRGNISEAINHLSISVEAARRSELSHSMAQGLANLGFAYTLKGRLDDGLEALIEAKALCDVHGYKVVLGEVLWKQAECFLAREELEAARKVADSALALARKTNNRDLKLQGLRIMGRVLRKKGEFEEALKFVSEAWQGVENDRDRVKKIRFAVEYALCLKVNGHDAEAKQIMIEQIGEGEICEPEFILQEITSCFSGAESTH